MATSTGAASPLPTSYGVWGSAVSSPSRVRAEPQKIRNLMSLETSKVTTEMPCNVLGTTERLRH